MNMNVVEMANLDGWNNKVKRNKQKAFFRLTCEFLRNHKQLVALWILGVERLVQGEVLLLQRKNLNIVGIREDCKANPSISSVTLLGLSFPFPS